MPPENTPSLTSRPYRDDSDLDDMLNILMVGRSYTTDWHYPHIGEFLFNYFMVACHLELHVCIRLWHHHSQLVAYAILGEDPSLDIQMLPEYEWTGIEAEAFSWSEETLAKFRSRFAEAWGGRLVCVARQDDLKRIAFLENNGFRYHGQFAELNMLRSLDEPIPRVDIPEGYQVLSMAQVNAIDDRAAAHREVWQPWSVGNISTADYYRFMHLPGYRSDLDVVTLVPDGSVTAYVNGWVDPLNSIGDLGPVGARPAFRQRGLTRLALLESLRRMQDLDMDRVCISTGIYNTPAFNLYSSLGFKVVNRHLDYVQAR
jgi:ribosomal protein S18 acetylase RimI-like enzyme